MGKQAKSALRATLGVTLIIFVSKAIGFIREIVFAACFGTGSQMDAYNAAYGLYYVPVLLFNSCISSTLIPLYIQRRKEKGIESANRFVSNVVNLFILASLAVSVLMMLLSGPIVHLTYWGYEAEKRALIASQLRIMLPSLLFLVTSIVLASLLNAREKYIAAQLTGFPLNFCLILAAATLGGQYGATALSWGVFVSGILQMLVLIPFLRGQYSYSLRFEYRSPLIRRMLALSAPAILSMAVNELNHLIDRSLASSLPSGCLSGMNYGYKLIMFMTGVLVYPLTTVMFSRMSLRAAEQDKKGVARIVTESLELLCLVLLPIIALCAILSTDIIRLVYQRGAFSDASVAVTAWAFLFYVLGVLFFGARDMLNRAFHALQDTRTTLINSLITVALNVALNLLLVRPMGVGGLALATSLSAMVGAALLFGRLRARLGEIGGRDSLEELLKIGVGTLSCALLCLLLHRLMPQAYGTLWVLLRLIVCAGVPMVLYLYIEYLLGSRPVKSLTGLVARRLRKG